MHSYKRSGISEPEFASVYSGLIPDLWSLGISRNAGVICCTASKGPEIRTSIGRLNIFGLYSRSRVREGTETGIATTEQTLDCFRLLATSTDP